MANLGPTHATISLDARITGLEAVDNSTLASGSGDESLVKDGVGPALEVKALTAGDGITLTSTTEAVTIESTGIADLIAHARDSTTDPGTAAAWVGRVNMSAIIDPSSMISTTDITIPSAAAGGAGTWLIYMRHDGTGFNLTTSGVRYKVGGTTSGYRTDSRTQAAANETSQLSALEVFTGGEVLTFESIVGNGGTPVNYDVNIHVYRLR